MALGEQVLIRADEAQLGTVVHTMHRPISVLSDASFEGEPFLGVLLGFLPINSGMVENKQLVDLQQEYLGDDAGLVKKMTENKADSLAHRPYDHAITQSAAQKDHDLVLAEVNGSFAVDFNKESKVRELAADL
ncbi:hypothetical protein WISP_127886 [Willisornis vidua]|uniref:Uncharacterized protein n=1 Tax=Willisornis vidua TaxID=1566151 RepID=A0ABQ9CQG8_9PASS|nr:hypothetical protein WISP_127886 [Willisornis vidua]